MEQISAKIELLKDIAIEYKSSLDSVSYVKDNYAFLVQNLETQLFLRKQEKQHFTTKAGVNLRSVIIENHVKGLEAAKKDFQRSHQIQDYLQSQYFHLMNAIQMIENSIHESNSLTKVLNIQNQEIQKKYENLRSNQMEIQNLKFLNALKQEFSLKKTLKPQKNEKICSFSIKDIQNHKNLLNTEKETYEKHKQIDQKYQTIKINRLNAIINETIEDVCNFYFIYERLNLYQETNDQNVHQSNQLGMQSNEKPSSQIDLYCDQDLNNNMRIHFFGNLQQITEKDEELMSISIQSQQSSQM